MSTYGKPSLNMQQKKSGQYCLISKEIQYLLISPCSKEGTHLDDLIFGKMAKSLKWVSCTFQNTSACMH